MTECGPIICYEDWSRFKPGSCGKAVPRMEVKVLSSDPENIPGEIVCRGPNVMLGYYKNEEATREAIDADGWLHTGDLALMDAEGNITIKGRSKNMLLGSSGQNIYPEEIEDKLNNMPYVAESIIVLIFVIFNVFFTEILGVFLAEQFVQMFTGVIQFLCA